MDSERCAVDEPDSRPAVVVKVSCPLCCDAYPEDCIEEHASTCEGRYEEPRVNSDLQVDQDITNENRQEPYSLADAVCKVKDKIDLQAIFSICVTREEIFHRGLKQWKRQKKATPINPLRVSFLGEAGIDNGALRKEFLTEMMAGIETNLFEGSSAGKNPKYSIMDYQNDNFKIAGEVIAVSIAQDGPPPNFFHEWSYTFISMGEFDKDQLSETDVTDPELLDLISKVETSDKAALIDLLERILACGYMGPVTCDKKASIVSAIVLHSRVRVLPMLQQICTGLKLYGLHDMIKQNPAIFQPLFVPGHLDKPDADFLVMALSPLLSEPGSLKRHKELRIVNFLQDFIQSMDDEGNFIALKYKKPWIRFANIVQKCIDWIN
uniref:HECT domain-containing protein n=1 Tax=Astyanax mexicanus TaxID=7994 RepID=A0A3B1KCN2_ASTMX